MTPCENYVIRNNVLFVAKTSLLTIGETPEGEPKLSGNTYVQDTGASLLFRWKTDGYTTRGQRGPDALLSYDPTGTVVVRSGLVENG